MKSFSVPTNKNKDVLDITETLQNLLEDNHYDNGILFVFVRHTTCAISTADLDPGTDLDYLNALEKVAPKLNYNHPHDPSHFNDHLWSTLIGTSLTIPVEDGKLLLGTWQRVVLFEFNGPRTRNISLSFVKE